MKYAVTTAPTVQPVTLADVKVHLRTVVGDTSEDAAILTPLIAAAREYCENVTGRALAAQTVKAYPDSWGTLRLPRPPINTITSIKYYDVDDTVYTLAATEYAVDLIDGVITILEEPAEELRSVNPIVIEYTAGYTTGNALPGVMRAAMLLFVADLYVNKGDEPTEKVASTIDRLLKQYKVWWF